MKNITTVLNNRKSGSILRGGKTRVITLAFLFIILLILTGCSRVLNAPSFDNMTAVERNSEIIGNEKDEIIGTVSRTIFDSVDRTNSQAESIETGFIEREGMEVKVAEGRYIIFAGTAGNVFIYDDQGDLLIREVFDRFYGVSSLTVDISDKHTIYFDGGLEGATIQPAETVISNELTPGIWEVGKDIEAGTYSASTEYGLGHLQVFERDEAVRVYELIGGEYTQTKSIIKLTNGQKLKITGVPAIHFEPTIAES